MARAPEVRPAASCGEREKKERSIATMATFTISTYPGRKKLGTVEADGYLAASCKAAKTYFKRSGAVRVTGDPSKSGVFAATRAGKGPERGATVLEERFHVA